MRRKIQQGKKEDRGERIFRRLILFRSRTSSSLSPHHVAPSDKLLSFGPARPLARTTFLSFSIGSERLTPHRNKTVSAGDLQDVGDRHETRLAADSWSHGTGRQGKEKPRPIIPSALPCSLPLRTARRLRPHKLPRDTTPLKLLSAEVLRQRERGDQRKLEEGHDRNSHSINEKVKTNAKVAAYLFLPFLDELTHCAVHRGIVDALEDRFSQIVFSALSALRSLVGSQK